MSTFHDALRKIFTAVDSFLNTTLKNENLGKKAEKERTKILELLQKLYAEYDTVNPYKADDGSSGSREILQDDSKGTLGSTNSNEEEPYSDDIPDTTVKALLNPVKSAYLQIVQKKRTDLLGLFSKQKCYCVIHKNIMYWFKKPGDKKQQGSFFITGYEFREMSVGEKDAPKKEFPFELICTAKKTYQFITESKEDLDDWMQAVVKARSYVPTVSVSDTIITPDDAFEGGEDVYEPIDEIAEEVKKSKMQQEQKATPKYHVQELDENDLPIQEGFETYDEASSEKTVAPPQLPPQNPQQRQPLPQKLPATEVFEECDEDDIYEAVDANMPPSHIPDPRSSVPDAPPPLPPHDKPANDIAPPPLAPPPLPSRGTTFPTQSLKALPALPQKKRILTLGNIELLAEDYENLYYGIWSCTGATDNELSFDEGEIVHVINREMDAENWWVGECKGSIGLVPKPFLRQAYELVA